MKVGDEVVILYTQREPPYAYSRHVGKRGRVERIDPTLWGGRHGGGILVVFPEDESADWFFSHQVRAIDVVTKLGEIGLT